MHNNLTKCSSNGRFWLNYIFHNSCCVLVCSSLRGRRLGQRRFSSHSLCACLCVAGFHLTIRRSKLPLWPEQKGRSSVTNRLRILWKSSPWQMSPSHSAEFVTASREKKRSNSYGRPFIQPTIKWIYMLHCWTALVWGPQAYIVM